MNPPRMLQRWWSRAGSASATPPSAGRTAVIPPSPWGQAEPVWRSLWSWLRSDDDAPAPGRAELDEARRDFCAALADLRGEDALDLHRRGDSARSLRELWHLRAELYGVVARGHSQAEADRRMARVNRHFQCAARPPLREHSGEPL